MKAYRITVIVVDHEGIGAESVSDLLRDNRWILPDVVKTEALEIGEWDDDHPLNSTKADASTWFEAERARQKAASQ